MPIIDKHVNEFKKLKGLILGAGAIGERHANNLKTLGVQLEKLSFQDLGLSGLIDKVKSSNVDFIVEALGTNHRHTIIPHIIEKKIPFYIEKPAYFDVSYKNIFCEISYELQKKSVVGFMMRYNPLIQSLIKDILSLKPFSASLQIGHDVKKWRANWNFDKSYASNINGGGVLLDLCHEIDIANILFSVDEVLSVNSKKNKDFEVDFATSCLLRNSDRGHNDILTNINLNYLSPNLVRKGSVYGVKGEIYFDLVKGNKTLNKNNQSKVYLYDSSRNKMFMDLMIDFLLSLLDKQVKNKLFPSLINTNKSNILIASCYEKIKF
jgi:predicted dehydrogenase